jgi:predicted metal-binding membrane protein
MGGVSATAIPRGPLPAVRARLALVALLLVLAAVAWWVTVVRMSGMDAGPGTGLGAIGWFLGVWAVMMAAMMLPALAPTVALLSRMSRGHDWARPLAFAAGYLAVWGGSGLLAYGLFRLGHSALGSQLAWHSGGRPVAAGVLALAAVYELTPLKSVCLGKCRSPIGFLLGAWRDGRIGAFEMGSKHALWCIGCCWALMAGLFALGVMSLTWMAVTAALVLGQKLLPVKAAVDVPLALAIAGLGIWIVLAPSLVPALVPPM